MAENTQWEYTNIPSDTNENDMNNLTKLGSEGWELVATKQAAGGKTSSMILKRPKQQQRSSDDIYGYSR